MADEQQDFKHIIRVVNTDLDGNKGIERALWKIKGVGYSLASIICNTAGIAKDKKAGHLSDEDVAKLEDVLMNPAKYNLPIWLMNRRKDYESGEDKHLLTSDLDFTKDNDLKRLKMIKSYRGLRHQWGLTVRGQKTKSNFRRNKGKGSLGVKRKGGKGGRV
ncbi:30S ribosomal protein S13 [Nanoarchaeota archaeon]